MQGLYYGFKTLLHNGQWGVNFLNSKGNTPSLLLDDKCNRLKKISNSLSLSQRKGLAKKGEGYFQGDTYSNLSSMSARMRRRLVGRWDLMQPISHISSSLPRSRFLPRFVSDLGSFLPNSISGNPLKKNSFASFS